MHGIIHSPFIIQETGDMQEYYIEMVRVSCYYSYKDKALREKKTWSNSRLCFDCSVNIVQNAIRPEVLHTEQELRLNLTSKRKKKKKLLAH